MAAFDVDNLAGIKEFYTRWGICEKKLGIQLTDVFDLVIIELNKAKKLLSHGNLKLNNNLEEWIKFFVKPYEIMEERNMEGLDEQFKF